jgi:Tol biopolymer transport system component/tRNA A-37 threonylcarbamoyl transferase component Bud32
MTALPPDRLVTALASRYRIERELGTGGMATVYLAEDVKHHRKVAIKVLKEELSASVGAARFLREIEIAAQLQHPNILPLLDSGDANGLLYFVMPFVDGQSLRQRLAREHELPVGEAVRILVELVDALAYAHAHGVVHRDIKPDNIMLSGRHALVTDFGVARAVSEATGSSKVTTLGVALGTPAYMSPEQATADPDVDQRADIYAVGVVAYELLTGRTPFSGVTPLQVLAAHVTEQPDPVSKHRPALSGALEQTVMKCLEKRPSDRWQSAGDLLAVLEPLATPSGGMSPTAARIPAVVRSTRLPWFAGAAVAAAVVIFAVGRMLRGGTVREEIGHQQQFTTDPGLEIDPALSPDGKLVAYVAGNSQRMRIFIRPVAGGRTFPLSDDSTVVEGRPRWSPDGTQLLFVNAAGVSVAPALGGATRPIIASTDRAVSSAAWSPDGRQVAFTRGDSLVIADATGQQQRGVAGRFDAHSAAWSPDGKWIAFVSGNSEAGWSGTFGNIAPSTIVVVRTEGGQAIEVTDGHTLNQSPEWAPDSRRLYFVSNRDTPRDVYAVGIGSNGRPNGTPQRLTVGAGVQSLTLSGDGKRIAYSVYSAKSNVWSLPVPAGPPVTTAAAVQVTTGSQVIESMKVSRDGKWLLYDSDRNGNADIYRIGLDAGTSLAPERLTSEPFDEFAPSLSPDGRYVAYHSFRTGSRDIEVKPLAGGAVELVTATPSQESFPEWSPDGRAIAFIDQATGDAGGAYVVRRGADGKWGKPVMRLAGGRRPHWSPDGRLLAVNMTSGNLALVSPDSGAAHVIYNPAGADPRATETGWIGSGAVAFKSRDAQGRAELWSIPVTGGRPRLLVRFTDPQRPSNRNDFHTDGKRFYFSIEDRQSDIWVAEVIKK